jgi:hypothetical protein
MIKSSAILVALVAVISSSAQDAAPSRVRPAKSSDEEGISCPSGRLIGVNGTDPITNSSIVVREIKNKFTYTHTNIVTFEPGRVLTRLRVNRDGRFSMAALKAGQYFFEVKAPEGKASAVFLVSENVAEENCEIKFLITRIEGTLVLRRSDS